MHEKIKQFFDEQLLEKPVVKNKFSKCEAYGSAPIYDKFVFFDEEKRKEWEDCDESVKKHVMAHLHQYTKQMENNLSIEMLSNIIMDLLKRIEALEEKKNET